MLPWGTCDSKVSKPGNLCSFHKENNTSTKANRSHAGGVLHAKEEVGSLGLA